MSEAQPASPPKVGSGSRPVPQTQQTVSSESPTNPGPNAAGRLDASVQERRIPHYIISEVELEDLELGAGSGDRQVLGLSAGVALAFFVVVKTVKSMSAGNHALFVDGGWFALALFLYSCFRALRSRARNRTIATRVRTRKASETDGS